MTFLARKGGSEKFVLAVEAVHLWHCFRSRLVSQGWIGMCYFMVPCLSQDLF